MTSGFWPASLSGIDLSAPAYMSVLLSASRYGAQSGGSPIKLMAGTNQMIIYSLRRLLTVILVVVTIASTSGCTTWFGYCMAKYNETICGKGDPEWGAGTDIPLYESQFQNRFKQFGSTKWTFAGDTVIASDGAGHLTMEHKQPDFKLQMKYRVKGDVHAGLAVRAENEANITASNSYFITLADGAGGSAVGSVAGLPKPTTDAGKGWGSQELEIILSGSRLVVSVNGKTVTDAVVQRTANGYIALTFHPGVSGSGRLHLLEMRQRWCHQGNPCLKPN